MEMKLYEIIGIRQWKKFVLWLMALIIHVPAKERHGGSYYLEGINVKYAKNFRKYLIFNGLIHTLLALYSICLVISNVSENDILNIIICSICFFINAYCIMLQRYNWLRINKILKKHALKKIHTKNG